MQGFVVQIVSILSFLLAILLVARLMRENRPPGSTMAWLLAILLIPYVGVPLYLLLGGRKIRRLAQNKLPLSHGPSCAPDRKALNDTEKILIHCGAPSASAGNRVEMFPDGIATYHRLVELIRSARHSIHVTTFILGRDAVGRALVEELRRKAQEGIKVRLLLDALGCLKTRGRFVAPLRRAGGKVGIFMPMLPLRRKWSANLRNHRKMLIIDGQRAMLGGMNLAAPYLGPMPDPSRWEDFSILIEGPAVRDVAHIFASDWNFATGEIIPEGELVAPAEAPIASAVAQIVPSGPDVESDPFFQALMTAFNEAKRRIWIATPYFIPDDVMARALALMARLGRDVRIVIPRHSNHYLADLARGSYLRQLSGAGVKFFTYGPGMLHAKLLIVDDSLAIAGSANIDVRSLYLNYEVALFLYSKPEVQAIERRILSLFAQSERLTGAARSLSTSVREWVEDASRILAPLL